MAAIPSSDGKKTGKGHPPVEHQFKPGQVANPKGRAKGSRNKLGEAFLEAMHSDFEQHGVSAIVEVRESKPDAYLKVIASILPRDLNVNVNNMDDLSDDELVERLRALESVVRPFLDAEGVRDAPAGSGPATAH